MEIERIIENKVHTAYYQCDINCARTMLTTLGDLFHITIEKQTYLSAIGLHGAGGHRDQCGLVEGSLMFLGIYFLEKGRKEEEVVALCYEFAQEFTKQFGSVRCRELRPSGFQETDPPHLCEDLTCKAIVFTYRFIMDKNKGGGSHLGYGDKKTSEAG
ncbi:MAG: C-GCAxxG-C-C family protein [Sphaerochaetaceae bacterium]|jgi:C_GCAxxG_C_C family probable redox protein